MWLYYLLKTMSTVISWLPYKAVVVIGKGMGHLYHKIAKKQRVRAEETIRERLGYSQERRSWNCSRNSMKRVLRSL